MDELNVATEDPEGPEMDPMFEETTILQTESLESEVTETVQPSGAERERPSVAAVRMFKAPTLAAFKTVVKLGKLGLQQFKTDPEILLTLSYADNLERSLRYLMWPLKMAMRVPFQVTKKKKSLKVSVNRKSFWFYTSCFMTVVLWVVWIWLSIGMAILYFGDNSSSRRKVTVGNLTIPNPLIRIREIELDLLSRFTANVFIIWTVLFHSSVASAHLLITCEDHATFVRDWFKAVDRAKVRASEGLTSYIIWHLLAIIGFSLILWITYSEGRTIPGVYGAANLMAMSMIHPLLSDETILKERENNERAYFSKLAPLGLVLYIFAVVSSRLNLLFFMVICRVFRQSSKLINRRIEMALGQRTIRGENAIHLDYVSLYKDHLQISALGKKIGSVFGTPVVFYFAIQMLCITLELSAIAYFDFKAHPNSEEFIEGTKILTDDDPSNVILNTLCHLVVSIVSFWYISDAGALAGEVAMEAFDITRRQGLILSINRQERNFVRSMWYSGGAKNPIIIQPANMFKMNRELFFDVMQTSFFYFVLMWQFKHNQNNANEMKTRRTYITAT